MLAAKENGSMSTPQINVKEFEDLVSKTQRKAYNMAFSLTGNRDDAEDLTQEAYLRAYRSFNTYKRNFPFERWFFTILRNINIDGIRRRGTLKHLSLDQPINEDDAEENMMLQLPDEEANPESVLLNNTFNEPLARAFAQLPETFRTAVMLCDVEGYSYEEISDRMNSSIGTVRSRIHRGRTLLRKLFLHEQKRIAKNDLGLGQFLPVYNV